MHYVNVRMPGAGVHVHSADVRVHLAHRGFTVITDSSRARLHSNRNGLIK